MIRSKVICEICGNEVSKSNIQRHLDSHKNPHKKIIKYHVNHDGLTCIFCHKVCKNKNALAQHEIRCKLNDKALDYRASLDKCHEWHKGKPAWNRGLTAETDDRVASYTKTLKAFWLSSEGDVLKERFSNEYVDNDTFKDCGRKGGLIGSNKQQKRSKNEIYFCELCEAYFKEVKHNEPIFNNWDADVIIEDIKYAILWNGPWHYKKIRKNQSLEQIQVRDKIKIDQIKACGYTPYIIKDMGSEDKKFVDEQFNLFISSLQK